MDLDTIIATELREFCEAMSDKLKKYRDIALDSRLTLTAALLHPLNRMELFDTAYPDYTKRAEKALRSLLFELFGNPTTSLSSTAKKSIGFPGRAASSISPLSAARARRRQLNSPPKGSRDKSSTTDKTPDEVD
ncbi:hypothetical protein A4X06_0g3442 [Tilletia controversa]|uniref:Uncharacterized protein n=1 Tax=Tilletia controversa TaxID=13291 RepID=A0A8X7MVQ2_9BASI|nr:hypothetical protein A4X06_0g3442 [Tilletia controversa]